MLQTLCVTSWQGAVAPERKWVVRDWIPLHTTTALYADGGIGKSLLAQQLMTCAAAGINFLGMPMAQIAVLGIFCEDDADELHRRQDAINKHYGIEHDTLVDMHILPRTGMDNALVEYAGNKPQPSAFYKELRQLTLDLEVKLVVIDTAADTFCGNENDRQHVRYYIQLLNGLAHDIGGSILLCAHPSVYGLTSGSGAGGSTAWSNTVRSRLYLERQKPDNEAAPDDNIRILSRKKANYAGINENITLYWESGVFNVKPVAGKDTVDCIKERVCMKDFLAAMRKLADEGIKLSVSKNSPSYAPKIVSNKIGKKYKYAEIDKAMSKLLDAGNIKNEAYGAPSKSLHRLVIVKEMES